jgi:hypothetical protein
MRGGGSRWARIGFVTLYALATLMAAFLVSAHAAHRHAGHGVAAAMTCNSDDGGDGQSQSAAACCDACPLTDIGGAAPDGEGSFLFRHEIKTRLNFALRLGQTADGTPDNLRSRAPPAPSV